MEKIVVTDGTPIAYERVGAWRVIICLQPTQAVNPQGRRGARGFPQGKTSKLDNAFKEMRSAQTFTTQRL